MVGPMLYLSGQLGMLADRAEWGAMNQEYVRFFTAHRPARSAFGTTGLALGARIELECTALAGRP